MPENEANKEIIQEAEKKDSGTSFVAKLVKAKSRKGMILRIIIGLLAPYAYLMLCGLIFDKALHLYNMTTFVFFSYAILQLLGIVVAIATIVNYSKKNKKKKNN